MPTANPSNTFQQTKRGEKIQKTMSTPQKHARNVPVSAVRNIVDFLMFFYNGKDDQSTHNFIVSHVSDGAKSDDTNLVQRYELYKLTAYLVREKNWDNVALEDLLSEIVELEKKFGDDKKTPSAGIAKSKWSAIKRKIVFQIGLNRLRKALSIEDDAEEITVPRALNIENYQKEIEQLFNTHKEHYIINESTKDVHHQFASDLDALTSELFTEAPTKKVAKAKSTRRQTSELTFEVDDVKALIEQYPIADLVDVVVSFVQLVEEKVLPVPIEVGRYTGADEQDIHAVLRAVAGHRLSGMGVSTAPAPLPFTAVTSADRGHTSSAAAGRTGTLAIIGSGSRGTARREDDWTDAQADALGPYASSSSAAAAGPSSAGGRKKKRSAVPKSPEVTESPERVRKQRRGSSSRAAAISAALAASDDFGFGDDTGGGFDDAGAGTDKLREARHRLLAYQDHDPLTEALGSGPAAAQARVSREALLRICQEQAEEHAARRLSGGSVTVSAAKVAKKVRAPSSRLASSARRGSKINFSSDDESLEEVDEDEVGEAGAVQTLRNLKQTLPTASTFPARLSSPSAAGAGAADRKPLRRLPRTKQVRIKWTFEQEEMLREAVARFGIGNWSDILLDPEYSIVFAGRTNVNLKDKWRNLELKEQREQYSVVHEE